jgi:hypothetical protein
MEGLDKDQLLKTPEQIKKQEDRELRENERLKAKAYEQEQQIKALQKQLEKAQEEKRVPGVQVVLPDGTYKKRKRTNSTGLSDILLPPYTKGVTAVYKMITIDEINPATGLKVEPVDTCLPGIYTVFDKGEEDPAKKNKVMQNIKHQERYVEDGQSKLRDVVEDIIFYRGFLTVNVETQYNLYVFMERHPMNKSNKMRPRNYVAAFERMDIQTKSKTFLGAQLDLAVDAALAIRDMKKDEIIGYAQQAKLVTSGGRPLHEIRTDLTQWAMNNTIEFYKMGKNMEASVQLNILDAINFGLVEYRNDLKSYLLTETEEVMFTHTAGEEPMKAFVKAMCKEENAAYYKAITYRLNYWGEE